MALRKGHVVSHATWGRGIVQSVDFEKGYAEVRWRMRRLPDRRKHYPISWHSLVDLERTARLRDCSVPASQPKPKTVHHLEIVV